MGAVHRYRLFCRPRCLGFMAACARMSHGYGVGEKKERVFMSAFLLPNAGGGQEPNRVRHGRLV